MRIAICSAGDLFGGVEKFILTLAVAINQLPAHRARVVLFSKGVLHDRLQEQGVDTDVFEGPRYDVTVVGRLSRFFRDTGVDLVHTHGYKATILCGLAAKLSGTPVVKTEHGLPEPLRRVDRIKMSVNLGLDRLLSPFLVHRIVYVSRDIRKGSQRYYAGISGEVIYNGIPRPLIEAAPRPPELDPSQFNLGIVGRLAVVKGHIYLLQALKDLPARVRLHVLGDGELRGALEAFSRENNLNDRVFFLGFRRNLDDYLRALDGLVMPSLHEGLPYTMLEAAYWGVPLIVSRVGGMQEVLTDNEECLLVEPGNVRQLTDAIAKLYADRDLRRRLGENARRKVVENFLIDSMVGKYLATYESCLAARAGEPLPHSP